MVGHGRPFDQYSVNGVFSLPSRPLVPPEQLLRHCLALGTPVRRPSAKVRLEQELGPELAQRLLTTLTVGSRG
jgi:hypothetical protein